MLIWTIKVLKDWNIMLFYHSYTIHAVVHADAVYLSFFSTS
jgi:hypothetical protein